MSECVRVKERVRAEEGVRVKVRLLLVSTRVGTEWEEDVSQEKAQGGRVVRSPGSAFGTGCCFWLAALLSNERLSAVSDE